MGRALDIQLRVIPSSVANPFVDSHHYSHKHVNNSKLHFGAFIDGKLHGVMSFGPPMDKSKALGLVRGTGWNQMLELNRMAFDEALPRNSESRCISVAMRLLRKNAPHVKWILSYADACQCGDGTIYRASNFFLTGIRPNKTCAVLPDGTEITDLAFRVTRAKKRPELGGGLCDGLLSQRDSELRGIPESGRREDMRGIPAKIRILHRQEVEEPFDRSNHAVLGDRQGRGRNVQGQKEDAA